MIAISRLDEEHSNEGLCSMELGNNSLRAYIVLVHTRVGTLIVATIYLQLI